MNTHNLRYSGGSVKRTTKFGLVGEIIKGFKQKGFLMMAIKFLWAFNERRKQYYIDLKDRPFFLGLVKYMNSRPVVAMGGVQCGKDRPHDAERDQSS